MKKKIRYIIITLLLLMAVPAALTKAQAAEGDIDVNELGPGFGPCWPDVTAPQV